MRVQLETMPERRSRVAAELAALLLWPEGVWAAGQISGVVANPSSTFVNQPVAVEVQGSGTCSQVVVRCQAPAAPEHVKLNVALPFAVTCVYGTTGTKTVTASAELPNPDCPGDRITQVAVTQLHLPPAGISLPSGPKPGTTVSLEANLAAGAVKSIAATPECLRFTVGLPSQPQPVFLRVSDRQDVIQHLSPHSGDQVKMAQGLTDFEFCGLEPDTLHYYKVVVQPDGWNGASWAYPKGKHQAYSSVWTQRRDLEVRFTRVDLHDDSDDLSDGDLSFWLWIDGKEAFCWGHTGCYMTPGHADDWFGSGETQHPNVQKLMQGIGKEAKWKLMGRDSDETGFYAQPDSDKFDRATPGEGAADRRAATMAVGPQG